MESFEQFESLNYPVKLYFDEEENLFVAEFLDLPGCTAYGETVEEAYRNAQDAKAEWLRVTLEQGLPVPRPSRTEAYSGRILVRLPTSLHSMLSDGAKLHGASVNQYIVHLLSAGAVGDTVSAQLEELRDKIGQLEFRTAQLSLQLEPFRGQFGQEANVTTGILGPIVVDQSQWVVPGLESEVWRPDFPISASALRITDAVLPSSQADSPSELHRRAR